MLQCCFITGIGSGDEGMIAIDDSGNGNGNKQYYRCQQFKMLHLAVCAYLWSSLPQCFTYNMHTQLLFNYNSRSSTLLSMAL